MTAFDDDRRKAATPTARASEAEFFSQSWLPPASMLIEEGAPDDARRDSQPG
jgi:hypothetical protein